MATRGRRPLDPLISNQRSSTFRRSRRDLARRGPLPEVSSGILCRADTFLLMREDFHVLAVMPVARYKGRKRNRASEGKAVSCKRERLVMTTPC